MRAWGVGGTVFDYASCLTVDSVGNSYTAGSFLSDAIDFGTGILKNMGIGDILFVT